MSVKETACPSSIFQSLLGKQRQDRIVGISQIARGVWSGHPGVILAKGDVPAIMQPSFDQPIEAFHTEKIIGIAALTRQAGHAV